MNLHLYIIINRIPQFTLGFTLDIVPSMSLDKYVILYTTIIVSWWVFLPHSTSSVLYILLFYNINSCFILAIVSYISYLKIYLNETRYKQERDKKGQFALTFVMIPEFLFHIVQHHTKWFQALWCQYPCCFHFEIQAVPFIEPWCSVIFSKWV